MIVRKDERALRKVAFEKVCPCVVSTSSLLSCDKSPSSLVDETPRKGVDDNLTPLGGSVFRQIRSIQRKPLPAFALFSSTYSSK